MPFDPTKPANDALVLAEELREQFNSLKAMFDNVQNDIVQLRVQLRDFLPSKAVLTDAESPDAGQIRFGIEAEHYQTFDIYIKTPGASNYTLAVGGFSGTEFSMSDLEAGTYFFKVIARSFLGDGDESDPVEISVEAS